MGLTLNPELAELQARVRRLIADAISPIETDRRQAQLRH